MTRVYLLSISRFILEHQSEESSLEVIVLEAVASFDEILEMILIIHDIIDVLVVGTAVDAVNLKQRKWRAAFLLPISLPSLPIDNSVLEMSRDFSSFRDEFI